MIRPFFLMIFATIICFILAAAPLRADTAAPPPTPRAAADALFDRASDLLAKDPAAAKSLFSRAAACYEQLLPTSHAQLEHASISYNAGTARQLAGETGQAVLHFRRAQLLAPITSGLRERLAAARAEANGSPATTASAPAPSAWQSTLDMAGSLPRSPFIVAMLACYILFWAILLLRIIMPTHARFRPRATLLWIPSICFLLCAPSVVWPMYRDVIARNEIVILSETIPRAEPDDRIGGPATTAPFKPGRELRVIDDRAGGDGQRWLRVAEPGSAADPLSVPIWIPAAAAARVFDRAISPATVR